MCREGFTGPKCDPVVPVALLVSASVGGAGVAAMAGAAYYYFFAAKQVVAAAAGVVPAAPGAMASQFSVTNIRVDLVIKTHQA
jgi:hypothetical protein